MVGQIEDMELSADDEIVTVAAGNKVHFFRFSAGQGSVMEPLKEFEHKFPVEAAALHPNRSCFIVGGTDLWVYTYDFESLELLDCKKGHHGPVHCLRFSPEGNSFSSGADDATLRLWSRDSGDAEEKVRRRTQPLLRVRCRSSARAGRRRGRLRQTTRLEHYQVSSRT